MQLNYIVLSLICQHEKILDKPLCEYYNKHRYNGYQRYADMAELADALDSGSSEGSFMQVQVLLSAPKHSNPNLLPIGETFGFVVFLKDVK